MRIAVVGATGAVGRHVVTAARQAGHDPVVLSRSSGVDVTTGAGLDEALHRAQAVIDVTNANTSRAAKAVAFFEASSRNLLRAGRAAGVEHHVALSIVGIDRVGLGYYAGKQRQEQIVLGGDVPASVLRATQFHEFAQQSAARVPGPIVVVPRMRSQPIAAREVAAALVALAAGPPVGRAPELAGPRVHELADLVRRLLQARGSRRRVVAVSLPGATGRAMAGGGLLPDVDGPRGTLTFDEWLGEQP